MTAFHIPAPFCCAVLETGLKPVLFFSEERKLWPLRLVSREGPEPSYQKIGKSNPVMAVEVALLNVMEICLVFTRISSIRTGKLSDGLGQYRSEWAVLESIQKSKVYH